MGLTRRGARQPADEGHGFIASGTEWWRPWRGQDLGEWFPIQQGQHALPLGGGRGAQKAEVGDALEATRQDVLEEAVEEAFGREAHRAGAVLVIAIGKGDRLAVVGEDALGAEGGAKDVSGEVFQGAFTGADGLNIGHPIEGLGGAGDLEVELRVVLPQRLPEASAEAQRQHGLGGGEAGRAFRADPAQTFGREALAGHHAMDVGMVAQVAGPGLEYG
jgi:hypothetical protein